MKSHYESLENKMVRYRDLVRVKTKDNGEKLVLATIKTSNRQKIFVRQSIASKLSRVNLKLAELNPNYRLMIYCGYRSLKIQTRRFLEIMSTKHNKYYDDPVELYESVHRSVAVPSVAGHPTGGAVDVTIIDVGKKRILNFGSKIYDYSTKKYYVFSPDIPKSAQGNRLLLRKIMLAEGFAPFDGEWWHFSYGDREWAFYYKKRAAVYGQIDSNPIQKTE